MADEAAVVISFKDTDVDEEVRDSLEKRCQAINQEFPETTRIEITVAPDGDGHIASARVSGRSTEVAAHATATELRHAADRLLDKLARQLRRVHDKRIFGHRREAKQQNPKRQS